SDVSRISKKCSQGRLVDTNDYASMPARRWNTQSTVSPSCCCRRHGLGPNAPRPSLLTSAPLLRRRLLPSDGAHLTCVVLAAQARWGQSPTAPRTRLVGLAGFEPATKGFTVLTVSGEGRTISSPAARTLVGRGTLILSLRAIASAL